MKAQTNAAAMERLATAPEHYAGMIDNPHPRFAVLRGARTVKEALAYLPRTYDLMESFEVEGGTATGRKELWIVIGGYDDAGWTLDGYVLPRLASGLIFGEEIGKGTEPGAEADEAEALCTATEHNLECNLRAGHGGHHRSKQSAWWGWDAKEEA